jgi:hypothetical protein
MGVTHPILRDSRGRVVGLGGRSRVDEHENRLLATEGWERLPDVGILLNSKHLKKLLRLYDLRRGANIRIQFHAPVGKGESGSDGWYSGIESGAHLVNIRLGVTMERMNYVIRHEVAHVAQAVLIGDGWVQALELALEEIEAEARSMAKSAEHLELVRRL